MNGCPRFKAEWAGNRTALTEVYRTAPFHLGLPGAGDDGGIEVIVQEVGPGLLPGDATETEIEVGPDAHVTPRGQAATKLYPCPAGERIETTSRLHVRIGGTLVYLPGELILYKEAELFQRVEVDIDAAVSDLGESAGDDSVWWGSGGDERVGVMRLLGPGAQAVGAARCAVLEHLLRMCCKITWRSEGNQRTMNSPP